MGWHAFVYFQGVLHTCVGEPGYIVCLGDYIVGNTAIIQESTSIGGARVHHRIYKALSYDHWFKRTERADRTDHSFELLINSM